MAYRIGDELRIELVERIPYTANSIQLTKDGKLVVFNYKILEHTPIPLEIGDKVLWRQSNNPNWEKEVWVILSLYEDTAWIKSTEAKDSYLTGTWMLERIY